MIFIPCVFFLNTYYSILYYIFFLSYHEKHPYRHKHPDFLLLAQKHPFFQEFVRTQNGRGHLNFKDPKALRALTQVLLKDLYGLSLTLPLEFLVPPVPRTLNYLLWVNDFKILGKRSSTSTNIIIFFSFQKSYWINSLKIMYEPHKRKVCLSIDIFLEMLNLLNTYFF